METRDKHGQIAADWEPLTVPSEELEVLPGGEEEKNRLAQLTRTVERHSRPSTVWPGTAPARILEELAAILNDEQSLAAVKRFDRTMGEVGIPTGVATLDAIARDMFLPNVAAAL